MRLTRSRTFLLLIGFFVSSAASAQGPLPQQGPVLQRVPENVILVKGAWSSASDTVTPLPEGGKFATGNYDNPYFGLTLPLPAGWIQKYEGPPPSDSGYYVLAQLRPADPTPGQNEGQTDGKSRGRTHDKARGTLLVAAQDMFFTTTHAAGPLELINYTRDHLQADYRIERPPANVSIAGRDFVRFGYVSPVAGLHWLFFATQIRCHVVEFIFTSADTQLLENLTRNLGGLKSQPERDADEPVCIKGYVSAENILERVDPVFSENKYNQVPVRVIIDREGKVKHIHFLSAFPSQSQAIAAALSQWRFKPYLRNGQPVEVETGMLFGRVQQGAL
jgi:Gram-negative bacterial TonB protein C-terminal